MFISVLDLFKIGIGPSSSHTLGPMTAAKYFLAKATDYLTVNPIVHAPSIRCILKGSLAFTGKGHATDNAIILGLHGYSAENLGGIKISQLVKRLKDKQSLTPNDTTKIAFSASKDIIFDFEKGLTEHPNGMIFELRDLNNQMLLSETYFSIGGGFISTLAEMNQLVAPIRLIPATDCPYPFDSAQTMLKMAAASKLSIAQMKKANELQYISEEKLNRGLDTIWQTMRLCVEAGLKNEGILPGELQLPRRAKQLHQQLLEKTDEANIIDWLCAYSIAVSEENAAGHPVVTAPTNGAAGVIPAILYYLVSHEKITKEQIRDFLLTAGAICGLIKHRSSISGAEVGCQGEVGSASSMAAAGLCEVRGGSPEMVENAAEIALEHHLGMTCDPVKGLVQIPCIERNGFGAVKAYTAASLALRGRGVHYMPLDSCIAAMKQTGLEMSQKFKETSLGGLAVANTEC